MANIIKMTKKFMLYNKRQHLQHTTPRPLIIKPSGHALSELEWKKFSKKYLIPVKLHRFVERSGSGSLVFFGEGGIDAATLLQEKYPGRFHFMMECRDKNTVMIGLALARDNGLKIFEVTYKEKENKNNKENHNGNNGNHNTNDPQMLAELAAEGTRILTKHNVKLA